MPAGPVQIVRDGCKFKRTIYRLYVYTVGGDPVEA